MEGYRTDIQLGVGAVINLSSSDLGETTSPADRVLENPSTLCSCTAPLAGGCHRPVLFMPQGKRHVQKELWKTHPYHLAAHQSPPSSLPTPQSRCAETPKPVRAWLYSQKKLHSAACADGSSVPAGCGRGWQEDWLLSVSHFKWAACRGGISGETRVPTGWGWVAGFGGGPANCERWVVPITFWEFSGALHTCRFASGAQSNQKWGFRLCNSHHGCSRVHFLWPHTHLAQMRI